MKAMQEHGKSIEISIDEFIEFCEKSSDVYNWGSPYGISFEKMRELAERAKAGCHKCAHYKKNQDICIHECPNYRKW